MRLAKSGPRWLSADLKVKSSCPATITKTMIHPVAGAMVPPVVRENRQAPEVLAPEVQVPEVKAPGGRVPSGTEPGRLVPEAARGRVSPNRDLAQVGKEVGTTRVAAGRSGMGPAAIRVGSVLDARMARDVPGLRGRMKRLPTGLGVIMRVANVAPGGVRARRSADPTGRVLTRSAMKPGVKAGAEPVSVATGIIQRRGVSVVAKPRTSEGGKAAGTAMGGRAAIVIATSGRALTGRERSAGATGSSNSAHAAALRRARVGTGGAVLRKVTAAGGGARNAAVRAGTGRPHVSGVPMATGRALIVQERNAGATGSSTNDHAGSLTAERTAMGRKGATIAARTASGSGVGIARAVMTARRPIAARHLVVAAPIASAMPAPGRKSPKRKSLVSASPRFWPAPALPRAATPRS